MKKSLTTGFTVASFVLFIIYMSMIVKLIMTIPSPYIGDLGPSFLPFGHIEITTEGFSIQNKLGSIILPLTLGIVVGVGQYVIGRLRGSKMETNMSQS